MGSEKSEPATATFASAADADALAIADVRPIHVTIFNGVLSAGHVAVVLAKHEAGLILGGRRYAAVGTLWLLYVLVSSLAVPRAFRGTA